jgi:hypothetical protein
MRVEGRRKIESEQRKKESVARVTTKSFAEEGLSVLIKNESLHKTSAKLTLFGRNT